MGNQKKESARRPRSLLSYASQTGESTREAATSLRDESELEHYRRMRALRLAAASDASQPDWTETPNDLTPEEAEQAAVDRLRAEMAAIKAELNRRSDEEERVIAPRDTPDGENQPGEVVSTQQADIAQPEPAPLLVEGEPAYAPEEATSSEHGRGKTSRKLRPLRWSIAAIVVVGTLVGVGKGMMLPVLVALAIAALLGIFEGFGIFRKRHSVENNGPSKVPPPREDRPTAEAPTSPQKPSRLGAAIRQVRSR